MYVNNNLCLSTMLAMQTHGASKLLNNTLKRRTGTLGMGRLEYLQVLITKYQCTRKKVCFHVDSMLSMQCRLR